MPRNPNIKTVQDAIQCVDRLHSINHKKMEQACVYDQHADALKYEGAVNALGHLLIEFGWTKNMRKREDNFDRRKVKRVKANN